ncbi:MAG TPA: hypothetical protein VH440_01395 [Candidatus Limnocylindrales bacterium]|jgi:hypothetical protein
MAETETHHEPTAGDLDHAERDAHAQSDVHGGDAHGAEALGPIDVPRWGAFLVGIAAGLFIALCLVLTIAVIGA